MFAPITFTRFHISLEIVQWEMARACCENKKTETTMSIDYLPSATDWRCILIYIYFVLQFFFSAFDEYFCFVHLNWRQTIETKRVNNEHVHEQRYLLFMLMDMDELSTPNIPPLSLRRSIYGFRHYGLDPINFTKLKRNECCW